MKKILSAALISTAIIASASSAFAAIAYTNAGNARYDRSGVTVTPVGGPGQGGTASGNVTQINGKLNDKAAAKLNVPAGSTVKGGSATINGSGGNGTGRGTGTVTAPIYDPAGNYLTTVTKPGTATWNRGQPVNVRF